MAEQIRPAPKLAASFEDRSGNDSWKVVWNFQGKPAQGVEFTNEEKAQGYAQRLNGNPGITRVRVLRPDTIADHPW